MGRFPLIILLCLCWGFSSVIAFVMNQPAEIEDGYFPGRSGDMVLKPTYYESPDISMVLLDQTGEVLVNNINDKISIYNVADLISCSFGLAPIHKNFAASKYIKSNFFHRPMANLLIELDSIGDNILNDPNIGVKLDYLNSLRHGKIDGFPVKMSQISYPTSTTSLATSLISGQKPSQHGIIANAWKTSDGSINHAYSSDPSTWSRVANLPDIISQTFHGKSLIVSLSGDEQKAKANGLNPMLKAHSSWTNDYIAYFRPEKGAFTVTSKGNNPVFRQIFEDLTAQNIKYIFAHHYDSVLDALLPNVNYSEGFVNFRYPLNKDGRTHHVRYDLSSPEDMLLFAELQSAFSLTKILNSPNAATLIQDDFLDFYSISFTSVTTLIEKYGRHSDQVIGALYLLDKIVPIILKQFSKSYPNRLLSEVVFFGSHRSSLSSNNPDKKELISIFKRLFPSQNFDDAELFPSLYIQDTGESSNGYCELLNRQLKEENIGFEVFCFSSVDRTIDKGGKINPVSSFPLIKEGSSNYCDMPNGEKEVCGECNYCDNLNWSNPAAKYWRQYCNYCHKCCNTEIDKGGKVDKGGQGGKNMQIPHYSLDEQSALTKVGSSKESIVTNNCDVPSKYREVLCGECNYCNSIFWNSSVSQYSGWGQYCIVCHKCCNTIEKLIPNSINHPSLKKKFNLCNVVVCDYCYYCDMLDWSKPTSKYWRQYCNNCHKCCKGGKNGQIPHYSLGELSVLTNVGSSKESIVTDADVRKYQIVLWISLLMFFVTVYTVYSMAFMSFKKDTLIYSTFNPNWENREARR